MTRIKLGETISKNGCDYWLVKDMGIWKNYDKKRCYVVMCHTSTSGGWWHLFNGTLSACREFVASR